MTEPLQAGIYCRLSLARDCWCCREPAVYLWTSALSGNQILLCVTCCADWRARAVTEPDLAASRIQQVTP